MSHLSLETLARLVDERPEPDEALHLERCSDCSEELEALRAQGAALAQLPDPKLPAALWTRLATQLEAEGLLVPATRTRFAGGGWLRHAAAIALFAAGGATGFLVGGSAGTGGTADGPDAGAAELASGDRPGVPVVQRVRQAEADYLRALAAYAEQGDVAEAYDPMARLAALESIVLTSRAALNKAPADPIINGYYLTAVAQREAMLKQLSAPTDTTWY